MPRKKTIRTNSLPYHVVCRSNQKNWFKLDMDDVWLIANESMKLANEKHPVNIHVFLLMSNHYHLVLDTPNADIDKFMYEFNKNFSLLLRKATSLENRMFGSRYRWSLLSSNQYYLNVIKYVLRNPIKANICRTVQTYKYSSLHQFSIVTKPYLNLSKLLDWFNKSHTDDQNSSIKRGLSASTFSYKGTRNERFVPTYDIPEVPGDLRIEAHIQDNYWMDFKA